METNFGLRGTIVPIDQFLGKQQSFPFEQFEVSVDDGILEIGYDNETLEEKARELADDYLNAFSVESGTRYNVELNQSWRKSPDGIKTIGIAVSDALKLADGIRITRETQVTQKGHAHIVSQVFDSSYLVNQTPLVAKCQKDQALRAALRYLNKEVIEDARPLYGIYKAIEALTKALPGGRGALGMLAGAKNNKDGKRFVDDIMETSGITRHHHDPNANQVLTDSECKERATLLIRAYANSLHI
jgi:hypothetical protein